MKGINTKVAGLLAATALAVPAALLSGASSAETVLKVIPHADLKNTDPIWTTAYITRNHGYMVYDTLFALDEDLKPQPQMAEGYTVSDDKLTWKVTLRDGLKFHDGAPVKAEDAVASLQRWGKRDGMGQKLFEAIESIAPVDDKSFEIKLKYPYGLVIDSIGKISSNVPFIMPKRLAETDPFTQVPEIVGSGPFKFEKEQWVPGSKVVYTKFADYVPRKEPVSAAAGGKVAKVDKVEAGMMHISEFAEDGTVKQAHALPHVYSMMLPAFRGVPAVIGIEGLTNPRGFIVVDKHQRNPKYPEVFGIGVCVAIPPMGKTPVPVGVPKTGFMIESMVTATAHNIKRLVEGAEPNAEGTWNAVCLADFGDSGVAFVAQPQIPPRNVNWSSSGKWVHAAKVGFEKYFLHKIRSGKSEPFYEKLALQVLGIDKLKSIKIDGPKTPS